MSLEELPSAVDDAANVMSNYEDEEDCEAMCDKENDYKEKRIVKYIHTPKSMRVVKKLSGKTTPETWSLIKDRYVVLKDLSLKKS